VKFKFPAGTKLVGYVGSGQQVSVTIRGGLGLGDMSLDGSYSCNSGYSLSLSCTEESFLSIDVGANVNQEVRIPIVGLEIPFGIGHVSGGLFLVAKIDGTFVIESG
jgi:hypothetical protein